MSNSSLTTSRLPGKEPDLSITINRSDLETVMMGKVTMDEQIAAGKAKLVGNANL